jgi:hypothetical protein
MHRMTSGCDCRVILTRVSRYRFARQLVGHTEGGGSIRTSLGVDFVWDFSLLTLPCRGAAPLLVVQVFVMRLFTVGIIALKLSLGVDVVGDVLGLANGLIKGVTLKLLVSVWVDAASNWGVH